MREAFGESFDVPTGYLNTASIGIPPATAADAVAAAVGSWRRGEARPADYDEPVATARAAWAELVGVASDRVAIGSTVSQLVGLVAASIPDGTRVLTAASEFTSVSFPFAAQHHRGVRVAEAPLSELPSVADEYDLVAVSVVQSADGAIVDLDALRRTRARVLLDVTQAAGWLPLRVDWADWVVGASYKWLLAPRGAAWLVVRDADELTPHVANWYSGEDPWQTVYGLPLRLARGARRLDLSPVWLAHVGAAASARWLRTLDLGEVRDHCVGLADALLTQLDLASRGSAIVALDLPEAPDIGPRLAAHGISAASRAGKTRLSFALYNTHDDVEAVLAALRRDQPGHNTAG
ncbi:MAG: aminotransferase class V-fold PLP-dependent enzyme [Pseudonocardiaceae bacterium]|nr:aminotransferase class V-fold PLP-dependent enzyme [Pseudonocardiaceae bacterium]